MYWPTNSDDPGYALIRGRIDPKAGAIVEVKLEATTAELALLNAQGKVAPLPRYGRGVIDTGAEVSCVNDGIAQALATEPSGTYRVVTAAGIHPRHVYPLSVTLGPDLNPRPDPIEVDAPEMRIEHGILLIGRDVLSRGELVVYGPDARFELVLPRGVDQFR